MTDTFQSLIEESKIQLLTLKKCKKLVEDAIRKLDEQTTDGWILVEELKKELGLE